MRTTKRHAVTIQEILNAEAGRLGGRGKLADALGLNSAHLSNILNGKNTGFSVQSCVRLAAVSGRKLTDVLRAGGFAETADLIEAQYGRPRLAPIRSDVSATDRDWLDRWKALPPAVRIHFLGLLRAVDGRTSRARKAALATLAAGGIRNPRA